MNSDEFCNFQLKELNRFTNTITNEIAEFTQAEETHKIELQERKQASEKSVELEAAASAIYKRDMEEINKNKNLDWWERENAVSMAMRRREQLLGSASLERMKTMSTGRYELTVMKLQLRTWLRSWFF